MADEHRVHTGSGDNDTGRGNAAGASVGRLKDTRINLSNVNDVEDAEYWLAVYFRLDCDAHLWQPAKRREHGERLILFGQEARELRGLLECVSLSLTPPVAPKPPEEW